MAILSRPPAGLAIAFAALAAVVGGWPAAAGPAPVSLEYSVKANYLYKFAPFVEWPAEAFSAPDSPFYLCVLGADPFGPPLDQAVSGQQVEQHPITVRRIERAERGEPCHVLYVGKVQGQTAAEALAAVEGDPVLTVTDQNAGTAGGAIHFVLRDGRVRFEIDAAAASVNGVTISSKLLGLAVARGGR